MMTGGPASPPAKLPGTARRRRPHGPSGDARVCTRKLEGARPGDWFEGRRRPEMIVPEKHDCLPGNRSLPAVQRQRVSFSTDVEPPIGRAFESWFN